MADVQLQLESIIHDPDNLNYIARAKIYDAYPHLMILTSRGAHESGGPEGGVSFYNVSSPNTPHLVGRWKPDVSVSGLPLDNCMEGQAVVGNKFIVLSIYTGKMHVLDIANPADISHISTLSLDGVGLLPYFRVLHVKGYESAGRQYVIITAPQTSRLIAVDITDAAHPRQVASVEMGFSFIFGEGLESIYIIGDYAYCGAFRGSRLVVADLSGLPRGEGMKLAGSLYNSAYDQMVSLQDTRSQYSNILYSAAWGSPGGVVAFDVSSPGKPREIGRLINDQLSKSNRIKIQDHFAFIPIELEAGGIGIVDINDPKNIQLVKVLFDIHDHSGLNIASPYAMAVKDNWLYVFGTKNSNMGIMKIVEN